MIRQAPPRTIRRTCVTANSLNPRNKKKKSFLFLTLTPSQFRWNALFFGDSMVRVDVRVRVRLRISVSIYN